MEAIVLVCSSVVFVVFENCYYLDISGSCCNALAVIFYRLFFLRPPIVGYCTWYIRPILKL